MKKIVTLCMLLALWTGAIAESLTSVSYYNPALEGDNKMTTTPDGVEVPVLDGSETDIAGGWYVISQNVTFNQTLVITGDVTLILADGASLNFEQADGIPIEGTGILGTSHSLTIYTQSIGEDAGRLSIQATQAGINVGSVSINGAVLDIWYNTAQSWATMIYGIFGFNNLNLTDAHVTISGPESGYCIPCSSASTNAQNAITRSTLTITGAADSGVSFPVSYLTIADSKVTTSGSNNGIRVNVLEIRNSEVTALGGGKDAIFSAYGVSITDSRVTATSQGTSGFGIMCDSGDMSIEGSEVTCIGNRGIHANGNAFIKDATVECPASYIGIYASKNLTIEGGKVTASGNAIGVNASILNIEGGKVEFTGGDYGIRASSLEIRNSEVTASSNKRAIHSESNVSITDSRVTATISEDGDCIWVNDGDMTIEGGQVEITGGNYGICTYGNVFIKGATVECSASDMGIYASKKLTIEGGKVTAISNYSSSISGKEITLGWTRADDYIKVSNFPQYASIVANSTFVVEGTNTILNGSVSYHPVHSDNPTILRPCIVLSDANDNTSTIAEGAALTSDEQTIAVALDGRTLYKDGKWNTLCLPFDLYLNNSVLDGDDVRLITLDYAKLSNGTLTLDFAWTNVIEAGVPYLIKWENTGQHLTNPVFQGVIPKSAAPSDKAVVFDDLIRFEGCYSPVAITDEEGDNTKLYLGAGNTLSYPSGPMTIGSCRAYFQLLGGHTAGEPENAETDMQGIRAFELNFGEEETGIEEVNGDGLEVNGYGLWVNGYGLEVNGYGAGWCTLDGRRLDGKPTAKGVYIRDGRKVIIK